ncbi:MAG: ABC transporter substrate-binding protein [Candidatus Verstraetearchaeota archaeon]|nr:ABC transporter substrate-binding protein [Candidatus Verstraetearchaeota archaeon]
MEIEELNIQIMLLLLIIALNPMITVYAHNYQPLIKEAVEYDYKGPRCDELYIVVIATPEAQMLALKKGEIDVLGWPGVQPLQVAEVMADPKLHVITSEVTEYYPLVFNVRKYPFNITDFRRAIAYCIDRKKIVEILLLGYGRVATSCIPKAHGIWHNPNVTQYEYNPAKAAEILDRLGFIDTDKDGIRNDPKTGRNLPDMYIMIPSYDPIRIRMAQLISGWAAEVGLPIKAAPTEHGTMIDKIVGEHDFDMCCWTYGWYPPWDPISLLYHSSQDVPWGWNDPGIRNSTWDALIDEILSTPSMDELKKYIWKFQEWHMQLIPDFPLFERLMIDAYRTDKTEGWLPMLGAGILNFWSYMNVHEKGKLFGGKIKYPVQRETKTLNPCKVTSGWDYEVIDKVYDTLMKRDLSNNYIPWMARSWDVKIFPENKTQIITFYLYENITWHDGKPLTGEDVKFTIEYYRDYQVPPYLPYVSSVYKVEVPSKYTVKIYLNNTSVIALYNIGTMLYILPKHLWYNVTNPMEYEPKVPIGSGPFKFVEWVKGEYVKLVYNDKYFRLPKERIIVPFELSNLRITPSKAYVGDIVSVTVTIKNKGYIERSQEIQFKVAGKVEDKKTITLAPGQSIDITFTTTKDKAGEYMIEVDGLSGKVTFEERPAVLPAYQTIAGTIIAIAIVAAVVYYVARKRSK